MSISTNVSSQENAETDSDTMSDVPADYQPISVSDNETDNGISINDFPVRASGRDLQYDVNLVPDASASFDPPSFQIPNFYNLSDAIHHVDNGIHRIHLNDDGDIDEREEEEEEEEKVREASESAISRAFTEDETRRNAPLTPENASRIMDAMRGIVFRGGAPDWVNQVPEEQWMDQFRVLRGSASNRN